MKLRQFMGIRTTLLCLAVILAACSSDDNIFFEGPDGGSDADTDAALRVIHAMSDAPSLTVSVEEADSEQELVYGDDAEPLVLEPGTVLVSLSRTTAPDETLIEAEVSLEAGDLLNLVIYGSLGANDLNLAWLNEDGERPDPGRARLHFLNAVHVDGDDWPVDLEADGEVLVPDAAYGDWQAATDIVAEEGENYALQARNQDGTIVTATPTGLEPTTRATYLIIAAGIWGDGTANTDPEILIIRGLTD